MSYTTPLWHKVLLVVSSVAVVVVLVLVSSTTPEEMLGLSMGSQESEDSSSSSPPRGAQATSGARSKAGRARRRTRAQKRMRPPASSSETVEEYGVLEGEVRSSGDDAPVRNAEVVFEASGQAATVRTDDSGTFVFRPSRQARYRLAELHAVGFASVEGNASALEFAARPHRQVRGVVVELAPATSRCVNVRNRRDEIVPGAELKVFEGDATATTAPTYSADLQGRVEFSASYGAEVQVRDPIEGVASAEVEDTWNTERCAELVLVPPPETRYARIAGTVYGVGGPVSGATVRAEVERTDTDYVEVAPVSTRTDRRGHFEFRDLPTGRYTIEVQRTGGAVTFQAVRTETIHLQLRIGGDRELYGQVEAAGEPVTEFTVMLRTDRTGPNSPGISVSRRFVDATGRFRWRDLADAPYKVAVTAYGYTSSRPQPVTLSVVQPEAEVNAILQNGGSVVGTVRDVESDAPIAGATIFLDDGQSEDVDVQDLVHVRSDRLGRFELTGVPIGPFNVTARRRGYHDRTAARIRLPRTRRYGPLELRLEPYRR